VNGTIRPTTYISATQVSAILTAADVAATGTLSLTAVNPTPGGGASAAISLPVNNPSVGAIELYPSLLTAGATSPITVAVTGNTFVPASVVQVGGVARTTTYVSSTTLTFVATIADQATAGTLAVTVTNPTPGGGTSPAASLTIGNPSIAAIQLNPTALIAGTSSPTTITVSGETFVPASVVQVGGIARATTYVNPTTLTFVATAADQATTGTLAVTVTNPAPGGGTSPTASLAVNNPSVGAIQLSPAALNAQATSTATITVTGNTFVSGSVVQVNGIARATTYVNSTTLTFVATVADQATAATLAVTVTNPMPGGGTSAATNLTVNDPAVGAIQLNPEVLNAQATSPATITVTGGTFVPASVVQVGGVARATTYVSPTTLTFVATVADQANAATLAVTVANPAPGGGTSPAVSLTVNDPPVGAIQLTPSAVIAGTASPTTITVTGSSFVPASQVLVNSVARATTYVSPTTLTFAATVADQASVAWLGVTVTNPAPGGGTSPVATLTVSAPTATPVITGMTPASIISGSPDTYISLTGTGFTANSVVEWNGTPLATSYYYNYYGFTLTATVPAADLATSGTGSVTVSTPTATPALSNAMTVTITNPPAPTLTQLYPGGGPINTAASVTLSGTGFTAASTVALNGSTISSTFVNSTQITCTIPASSLALPGNANITVTTPAPGGGTTAPLAFTTFLAINNNDIVYNPTDGLLYASVPISGIGSGGNTVEGIDPVTGTVMRQIWVGSNPNKLALSTDGTQLFVGLDGAGAVAQVDLTQGALVNQFSLGTDSAYYNSTPNTASYLAAVPGSPNSVAVATQGYYGTGSGVTIYDSGVARANSSSGVGYGSLSFGSSSSILYMVNGGTIEQLTVGSSGITAATTLATTNYSYSANSIQYDNGQLYLSDGQVFSASTGALLGTFYSSTSSVASGPIVSDSTLGRAFIGVSNYSSSAQVMAFNESTFNSMGSIAVNSLGTQGYSANFQKIVRWGQNGIALSATASAYSSTNQIFIFQSPLVQDLSASPADLSVTLTAPATASTGTAISWVATISNNGPNPAQGAALALNLDSSLILSSVTPSQGTCGTGTAFACDLGNLANGASATVTVSATPSASGTLAGVATVSSVSTDPTTTNNQASTSTVVSGSAYGAVPTVSAISPNFVQAGSTDFTLTVTGAGFDSASTVNLGTTALTTTYVSATQLTAAVTASEIANYGWAAITVSNPTPGGGVSQVVPLTIYAVVNVPASGLLFDPYGQQLYATLPGTATNLTGNSVVAINPYTAVVGTPVNIGSEPTVMAETADGNYLYVGLSGANSLAQFNLGTQSLTATVPLSYTQWGSTSSVAATWLSAMPGSDTTLAVAFTYGVGILDINGSTGTFRANYAGGSAPQFGDSTHLYTGGNGLTRYTVNAQGATQIDSSTLAGLTGSGGSIQVADGMVYGVGGGIVNPSTTPPSQIATLPMVDFYESGISGYGVAVDADPSLQKDFLMMENTAGTWAYGLVRYDLTTYTPEGLIVMPTSMSNVESGWAMTRFGQDGLAFLATPPSYYSGSTTPVVMLVRGPFVAPQLLSANSAATLASSSSGSIAHGSGNTILTLTGSALLPGVAVTWNGSYRTTTWLDSMHATVAIPASDLAAAGTASLVATNPGAPASNALSITIN
jgi:hypothetical protein